MATDEFDLTITAGKSTPGRRKNNLAATVAPTATDDSSSDYEVMSLWVDTTADKAYICVDSTATAAVWKQVAGDGTSVATDAIWDAKGDLAVGTGADTAQRLAVGTDGQALIADSAETTGLRYGDAVGELIVSEGITDPPESVWSEDGSDWIYGEP